MFQIIRSRPQRKNNPSYSRNSNKRVSPPEIRLQHLAERLHALGPGPLLHFLREIDAGAELVPTLERYGRLPLEFVQANAGDRLPEPMMLIKSRQ